MNNETLWKVILGITIPFIGTLLGSAMVYIMKNKWLSSAKTYLYGLAAGVMVAASLWSLLLPALEMSSSPFPVIAGFISAVLLFSVTDLWIVNKEKNNFSNFVGKRMAFAVTLHNIPEGMAVGVIFAGALSAGGRVSLSSAMMLSLGIAIQNFPEGSVISMPLNAAGVNKHKSFFCGTLSGVVEPVGAILALMLTHLILPILPFLLSFAAGAMIFVVADEIIPELHKSEFSTFGIISLGVGFCLMMALDVLFG